MGKRGLHGEGPGGKGEEGKRVWHLNLKVTGIHLSKIDFGRIILLLRKADLNDEFCMNSKCDIKPSVRSTPHVLWPKYHQVSPFIVNNLYKKNSQRSSPTDNIQHKWQT